MVRITIKIAKWVAPIASFIQFVCCVIFFVYVYSCPLSDSLSYAVNPAQTLFEEHQQTSPIVFQDHSTHNLSEKVMDPTPGTNVSERLSHANEGDELNRTPGINVGNPNLLSHAMPYSSHVFGRLTQTILTMVSKSKVQLNESDEARKNMSSNLNEETAGKPDGCKRSEIIFEEIKSRLKEIIISMSQDSTQEHDLTELIIFIVSKTFPETELAILSDIASKIVSDSSSAKQAVVDVFSTIIAKERSHSSSINIPSRKKRNPTKEELDGVPCKLSKDLIMAVSYVGLLAGLAWMVAYFLICCDDAKESPVAEVIHLLNVKRRLAAAV